MPCGLHWRRSKLHTNAFRRLAYPESYSWSFRWGNESQEQAVEQGPKRSRKNASRSSLASPISTTAQDLVRLKSIKRSQTEESRGAIYRIPCSTCSSTYIGETGRGLRVRLREHQKDFTTDSASHALVQHARKSEHFPHWASSQTIQKSIHRTQRRALETAYIQSSSNALKPVLGSPFGPQPRIHWH